MEEISSPTDIMHPNAKLDFQRFYFSLDFQFLHLFSSLSLPLSYLVFVFHCFGAFAI